MDLLTLLNAALRRVHTRALARCCATDLPDVVRALAAELALELDEPTPIATTSTEMRVALRELIDAIESQHLSPEARARVAVHLDRLRSVATVHERMVGGSAREQEATP